MSYRKSIFLILSFLLLNNTLKAQWHNPTNDWKTLGPPKGELLIIGGGAAPDTYRYFVNKLTNLNDLIVLIPTAGADNQVDQSNSAYKSLLDAGAKNIVILHTRDRNIANTEEFVKPLREAKAVFISGGYQQRLAQAYVHTLTHTELFNILNRGGIVAGSSAGASIQGSFLYGGKDEKEGFGFIKDSAIGQHYFRRHRMGSVARILKTDPKLIGLGIDENTGIGVKGNEFVVFGDSKVSIYDTKDKRWKTQAKAYTYLYSGDQYNLLTRSVIARFTPEPSDILVNSMGSVPSAQWETSGPPKGKLIFSGNENTNTTLIKTLIDNGLTKNQSIVILSTGNQQIKDNNSKIAEDLKKAGFKNVSFIHTINTDFANSLSFCQALKSADVVWIGDGAIWQYADTYFHTLAHSYLFDVLDKGSIILGRKTGTALMSTKMFGEVYNWKNGFALSKNIIYSEQPLSKKEAKTYTDLVKEDPANIGIGFAGKSIFSIESNTVKNISKEPIRIIKPEDTKLFLLSKGEEYKINRE